MTVFTSRFRRDYVRRRSTREICAVTLAALAFLALIGLAGLQEERDARTMDEEFTPQLRHRVVSWQSGADRVEISEGQVGAR